MDFLCDQGEYDGHRLCMLLRWGNVFVFACLFMTFYENDISFGLFQAFVLCIMNWSPNDANFVFNL